jgi:hypothetical protein
MLLRNKEVAVTRLYGLLGAALISLARHGLGPLGWRGRNGTVLANHCFRA